MGWRGGQRRWDWEGGGGAVLCINSANQMHKGLYRSFTVAAPNTAFTKYLKQIKYQMLVVIHPQSDENVRLRWCF